MLTTLFLGNSCYSNDMADIQHVLTNLHNTEELFFKQTRDLCNALNINENQHYFFEFINIVYKLNIPELFSTTNNNDANNSVIEYIKNNEQYNNIYNILRSRDNPTIINNINEIFETRNKITHLRNTIWNLESEKINKAIPQYNKN